MSKGVKVGIWVVVLALCAAAGAFAASRSDPFPPGVEEPGARPTGSVIQTPTGGPTSEPPADVQVGLRVDSEHELNVGGTCFSNWRGTIPLRFADGGRVRGQGEILLSAGGCEFDTAQVQTILVTVEAEGTLEGDVLRLRFDEVSSSPAGSQDLGGFVATLRAIRPVVRLTDGDGRATVRVGRPDGELGRYRSVTRVDAACSGC
ncbi:MAG: hypothetical protein ACXWWX_02925 [Actinomycetota bacterium]